jgi:hypothetical protein
MQDSNFKFHPGYTQMWEAYQVVKALAKVPFTEENSTSDLRMAIEFLIETIAFSLPLPTQRRVMGQDMPMSELAQLLHQMAEIAFWHLPSFDLDVAINYIRASRNS